MVAYRISSANDFDMRDPKDWQLQGSNDGKEWVTIDEQKDQDFPKRIQTKTYTVKKPGAYGSYKLIIAANHGDSMTQLSEIEFLKNK